jgi:hypothetical protein
VRDNLFFELACGNNSRVIGYVDIQKRQLSILDFTLKLSSYRISGYDQGNLIVRTEFKRYSEDSFYKIPFG